jgi:DNA-binding MarR family transcriptional regulator
MLIDDGLVQVDIGKRDKRERTLILTLKGRALENELSIVQRDRMRLAYKAAGPDAVAGFRTVLNYMIDSNLNNEETDNKNYNEGRE